eukprot:m.336486 g.336486  ORF g.336486 m.336486 type:complete len:339 (-) comp17866_c0_seq1:928-1944(-)
MYSVLLRQVRQQKGATQQRARTTTKTISYFTCLKKGANMAVLFGFVLSFFATYVMAQDLAISMKPMVTVPDNIDKFAGFYFQPYEPTPSVDANCYETCPCSMDPKNTTGCFCDVENVCGGEVPLDLESNSKIIYHWDASSDDKKYISIKGQGRTRIELEMKYDCGSQQGPYKFLEYDGTSMNYSFEFVTSDGYEDADGSAQSYQYNSGRSFVEFGKCDGCGSCLLSTRLQMDPGSDGNLNLNFKSLTFSVSYDNTKVVSGTHDYEWSTSGYCWMRDSNKRREARSSQNVYEIKELPTGTQPAVTTAAPDASTTATDSATRWASNVLLLPLLIIMNLLN